MSSHHPQPSLQKNDSGSLDRMITRSEFAGILRVSLRQFDRYRVAGLVPEPDFSVGTIHRWWPATVREFTANLKQCDRGLSVRTQKGVRS